MAKKLNLTGQRYGHLTVIKEVEGIRVGKRQVHKRRWLCRCDCGNEITVITDSLRNGITKSCGCIKPENVSKANLDDLTGRRFGQLTVVRRVEKDTKLLTSFWLCRCVCGNETVVSSVNLKSGNTKSCGHLRGEKMDYFALGFLWGIGRITDEKTFLVQYNDEFVMKKIRDIVSHKQKVFPIKEKEERKTTYRLKLHMYNSYVYWMRHHGYEGRKQNEERTIPTFSTIEQEAEFLRGYFFPHHSIDVIKIKGRYVDRLRFYASKPILERLNQHLHNALNTSLKKIQPHNKSNVCHILYYQSKKEVPEIIKYLRLVKENENEK